MKQASKWLIFTLLAVAQFMVVLDVAIVNVALPSISQALGFSPATLQWVVTAYALAFGGFLLLGGRAADLFGRKRVLQIGMAGFTLFSLLIGLASSASALIILRALQGLAAALMSPAALSLVLTVFRENDERNRALGLWTIVATGGAAVGLLLGGVLSQYLGWRWNFFVNVPVGVIVSLGIWRLVPAHAGEARQRSLDLPGAILVTAGLIAFVYGLSQAPVWGWLSGATLGTLAGALALLVAFVWNEARAKHPLMPLSIFKIRNVTGANLLMAPVTASMMGMFFLTSLYMSAVLHYSPVVTGLSYLPFPVILAVVSNRVSKLVGKYGYKRFIVAGPIFIALGLAWLSRIPVHGHYWGDLLPTLILMPIGVGLMMMPVMASATAGVPAGEAGLAAGLINTAQQMGGALGLAILSGVAASVTAAATTTPLVALVHGYHVAYAAAVIFMALALVLGLTIIREPRRQQAGGAALETAAASH